MKLKEISPYFLEQIDYRQAFNESWLFEMPKRLNQSDDSFYGFLLNLKQYCKENPKNVYDLGNGWFKYQGISIVFYWYKKDDDIIVGGEFDIKPQSTIVIYSGKNPNYKNQIPYASDLYELVLKDQNKPIGLESDKFLSDSAFKIWSKLLSLCHKIKVYDIRSPGSSFKEIKNIDDLKSYFSEDENHKNFRYILAENNELYLELKISKFGRRKYQKENNLPIQ
jgi:hypothetical protein